MPDNMEFQFQAIAMELLPAAVQIVGIGTLLYLVYGEPAYSIAAIIISLIWLKSSHSKMAQEFGQLRTTRFLFGRLAGWLNQPDGESEFDSAASEFMMFEGSIEENQYRSVVIAAGLANGLRGLASFVIYGYLVFTVADHFWHAIE